MRYRKLDSDGDYSFGQGPQEFLVNSPDAVAQAIRTRLLLETGEWFLNDQEGTPYKEQILGANKQTTYDVAIKERILGTPGVITITNYASYVNPSSRGITVNATVSTIYGTTQLTF